MTPWLALALLALSPPFARGEEAGAAFSKLRHTAVYQKAVIAGAYKSSAWLANRCESATASLGAEVLVASPPVIDASKGPQSGSWIEHVMVEGCGAPRRLNVLVQVRRPNTVGTVPLLPGTTRADPTLQRDGELYAFAAAVIDPEGCKPVYIGDTDYLGPLSETPLVAGKPGWSERWTVVQCDRRVPVTLRFQPDAKGTRVTAKTDP